MGIRIILADDHQIIREGISALLSGEEDMEVIAQAADGEEAVEMVKALTPDVVLMDVSMPKLDGIGATRMIMNDSVDVKVIALSIYSEYVPGMIQAGASGYLLKECAFIELVQAIRSVLAGNTYLSPGITRFVIADYIDKLSNERSSPASILTKREQEVLRGIADGMATRDIAAHLEMSTKTVDTHRRQMMKKLGIRNIAELTKYAIKEGLSSL